MRRELVIFAVILTVMLTLALFGRSLMLNVATARIKSAFPGYEVSVGDVEIKSIDMISVTGIKVQKESVFIYRIKSVDINLSPLSLFTRTIPKITIKNTDLQYLPCARSFKDIIVYPTLRPFKDFTVKSIVVSNLVAVVNTGDWKFNIGIDGSMEMRKTPAGEAEIKGDFSTVPGGGKISIKDEAFLKRLAKQAKQPLAVIEDLKDYDYTKCDLQISGKPASISLHMMLDGAKGKKDLTFPLSGFFK